MQPKIRNNFLGIYSLLLAIGAVKGGIAMILKRGSFVDYPQEWILKVPFESWVGPGIIAIALFGLGNGIAGIYSLRKESKNPWLISAIMGGILFIALVVQVITLEEVYMATIQFFTLSIGQLLLSIYVFWGYRRNLMT